MSGRTQRSAGGGLVRASARARRFAAASDARGRAAPRRPADAPDSASESGLDRDADDRGSFAGAAGALTDAEDDADSQSAAASDSDAPSDRKDGPRRFGGDSDSEASDAGSQTDEVKRRAAVDEYTDLERQFAQIRSRLYDDRMSSLAEELALVDAGTHPALAAQYADVAAARDARLRSADARRVSCLQDADLVQQVAAQEAYCTRVYRRAQWRASALARLWRRQRRLQVERLRVDEQLLAWHLRRGAAQNAGLGAAVLRHILADADADAPLASASPNHVQSREYWPSRPFRAAQRRLPDARRVVAGGGFPAATLARTSRLDILEDLEALDRWHGPLVTAPLPPEKPPGSKADPRRTARPPAYVPPPPAATALPSVLHSLSNAPPTTLPSLNMFPWVSAGGHSAPFGNPGPSFGA